MSVRLNFNIESQIESRLCWAAVTVSIARYYLPENTTSQIELAKNIFGAKYNQFCPPEKALSALGNLSEVVNSSLERDEIIRELKNQRPIIACLKHFVGWHLAVIHGIDTADQLSIADPLYGNTIWSINEFNKQYHQTYRWTHTYKTTPNSP